MKGEKSGNPQFNKDGYEHIIGCSWNLSQAGNSAATKILCNSSLTKNIIYNNAE